MDDASLYKHIDSELPDSDRARQLIMLCAARAPLPALHEGKVPPNGPSEKGVKLLQEMRDSVLLLLAERKLDLNVSATDQPSSVTNGNVDLRPNEQNVNNRARTTRFKDEIQMCVFFFPFYVSLTVDWTIEQRQKMTRGLRWRTFTTLIKKLW